MPLAMFFFQKMPFHPDDPLWLKQKFIEATQNMRSFPNLSAELREFVRKKGRLPRWICDFVKQPIVPETEEGEEENGDLEQDEEEEEIDKDEGKEEREEEQEVEEDDDDKEEGEKGEVEQENQEEEDGEEEEDELEKERESVNKQKKEAVSTKKRTKDSPLAGNFERIHGTNKYICLVNKCNRVLSVFNKKEHLRAMHKMFPPFDCDVCAFQTFSKGSFRRHKAAMH